MPIIYKYHVDMRQILWYYVKKKAVCEIDLEGIATEQRDGANDGHWNIQENDMTGIIQVE